MKTSGGKNASTIAAEQGVNRRTVNVWKAKAEERLGKTLGISSRNTFYFSEEEEREILSERPSAGNEKSDEKFVSHQTAEFVGEQPTSDQLPVAMVGAVGAGAQALAPVAVAAGHRLANEMMTLMLVTTADSLTQMSKQLRDEAPSIMAQVVSRCNLSLPTTTTLMQQARKQLEQDVEPLYPGMLGW